MDAEEGWLAHGFWEGLNVFGKKGFDDNEPLILDPAFPFGPQSTQTLSQIDLEALVKLNPIPTMPEGYS